MVHALLKPGLEKKNFFFFFENFEHYFTSVWDEYNCAVIWAFFGITFLYYILRNLYLLGHTDIFWKLETFDFLIKSDIHLHLELILCAMWGWTPDYFFHYELIICSLNVSVEYI